MLINEKKIYTEDNSNFLLYKAKIECGDIIAGLDMITELNNLREDMLSGEYIFDTKDSDIRIDFIENCIKLTKSPFYGMPMILLDWQKAFIECLYAFKIIDFHTEQIVDRFLETLMLITRKGGKTELISGLEFAEMILGGFGLDIVCSGTNDGTADLAYQTIDTMRLLVDPRSQDTWRNQKGLKCFANNNHIYKLSDSSRQKEGRSIDIAGIDEAWALLDDGIYKPIQQSTSTKEKYKIFIFGSEGTIQDGFLDKKRKEYTEIIYGENTSDAAKRKLPWLYTQDSESEVWETNEDGISRLWEKSNPSIGKIKKWSYLKERVEEARVSKADRIFVLCKDFNIKQNSAVAWLNLEDYDYPSTYNLEDFRGCYCIGGVDLAETTDLCNAKVLLMKPDSREKFIISHYFLPETKLKDSDDKLEGAKYSDWAKDGHITISEGGDVDLSIVADWFYSLYTDYGIKLWKCGYDQRFAKDWIRRMDTYGWSRGHGDESDLIMINQNAYTLSNAIKLCESDFKAQLINYNENPVDKWCFGNAGLKVDDKGNALIVKMKTEKRIDGAVALAIMMETYRRYRTDFKVLCDSKNKGDK